MVVVLLWIFVTAINFNKAFHIDDTFHLEAGQWIMNNWFAPLSGTINWGNNAEAMYMFNQPVLFFYCVAFVGEIFSFGETPMHLLLSVFSFFAIFFFYKIQRLLFPNGNLLALALFALCPAFIVNQNVMTDIPLLAFILGFVYHLFMADVSSKKLLNYALAGLFLTLSLLTKYTALPLLLVLVVAMFARKDFRFLPTLGIPIGALILWSFWNYSEFEGVHLLGRQASSFSLKNFGSGFLSFVGCLAAIFPLYFIFSSFLPKRYGKLIFISLVLGSLWIPIAYLLKLVSDETTLGTLNIAFSLLGIFMFAHLIYVAFRHFKEVGNGICFFGKPNGIMFLSFLGLAAFVILFAPFMATRHVLLTLPFLILLNGSVLNALPSINQRFILFVTAFLGLALGVSDYHFAQYYKDLSLEVPTSTANSKVWSAGHWGWQWYSVKTGAEIYDSDAHKVRVGDRLVAPLKVSQQEVHPSIELQAIDSLYSESTIFSFFAVHNYGSLYTSRYKKPAWNFSTNPIDTIVVYRINSIDFNKNMQ